MNAIKSKIETLLYGEEGYDLDFKSEQYKFTKASDEDKSELLKDILAFANSWCRSDAYIIIGVNEVKGKRNDVVGIEETFDDAQIQQFVNSKTNKPITFSYRNIELDEKTVAVIHIPRQIRPFYLKKTFGRLKPNTVYIKRGSSTGVADLDEISKMGIDNTAFETQLPDIKLYFADIETRRLLEEDERQILSTSLVTPKKSDIPDYERERDNEFGFGIRDIYSYNHNYYRELADYLKQKLFFDSVAFAIKNEGNIVAKDVRIHIKIENTKGNIYLIKEHNFISEPKSSYNRLFLPNVTPVSLHKSPHSLSVSKVDSLWFVDIVVDKVQAKSITWFEHTLYVGVSDNDKIKMNITISSDDMPEPQDGVLELAGKSKTIKIETIKELEDMHYDILMESPEFLEKMKRHMENIK